jgi:DNA repair protein RadD
MITLYQFQLNAADDIDAGFNQGARSQLLVSPTGSGKTIIMSESARRRIARYQPGLVIAHRREIIKQTADKLRANGIEPGIIMAEVPPSPQRLVQVASVDTLRERALNRKSMPMPLAKWVFIDEAHHAPALTYQRIIDFYPDAEILGATATPCRGDGLGLGNQFETLIECPQVAELIQLGLLVRSRVYAPIDPDLKGVRTQAGDYVVSQLSSRMDTNELVGGIVEHWHKFGEGRQTVAFACDVAHSVHIRDEFLKAGIRAKHLDGKTPIDQREKILAQLKSGETQVVSNCMVLTEGWDMPAVSCLVLARPTKAMGLFRQMAGRVLRAAPDKSDAVILDHSGAVYRHGLPEDPVEWTLQIDRRAINPKQEKCKSGEEHKLSECPKCQVVMMTPPPCACCGWMPATPRAREHEVLDGELGLVTNGHANGQRYTPVEKRDWHAMFKFIQREGNKNPKMPKALYKNKFGHWPPWGEDPVPIPPTPEVRSYVHSRRIAYAKAMEKKRYAGPAA